MTAKPVLQPQPPSRLRSVAVPVDESFDGDTWDPVKAPNLDALKLACRNEPADSHGGAFEDRRCLLHCEKVSEIVETCTIAVHFVHPFWEFATTLPAEPDKEVVHDG